MGAVEKNANTFGFANMALASLSPNKGETHVGPCQGDCSLCKAFFGKPYSLNFHPVAKGGLLEQRSGRPTAA